MNFEKRPLLQIGLKPSSRVENCLDTAEPKFLNALIELLESNIHFQTSDIRNWLVENFYRGDTVAVSHGLADRIRNVISGINTKKWKSASAFKESLERRRAREHDQRRTELLSRRREVHVSRAFGETLKEELPELFVLLAHHDLGRCKSIGSVIYYQLEQLHDQDPKRYFDNIDRILGASHGIVTEYENRRVLATRAHAALRALGYALPNEMYNDSFATTKDTDASNEDSKEPTVLDRFIAIATTREAMCDGTTEYDQMKQDDFAYAVCNAYMPKWQYEEWKEKHNIA